MGSRYCIDSNIIIYYENKTLDGKALEFVDSILIDELYVSVISKIECLGWKRITTDDQQQIEAFLMHTKIIQLSEEVVEEAINIRRQFGLRLANSIVASSCKKFNATLVTRNSKDFIGVSELETINPFEL